MGRIHYYFLCRTTSKSRVPGKVIDTGGGFLLEEEEQEELKPKPIVYPPGIIR